MEKRFLKRLNSLILCLTLVSTQVFAETEVISYLINSSNVYNNGLNYDGDDSYNHDDSNIIKGNQVKLPNLQVASYQNNVLGISMLEDRIFEYELFFASQLMKKDMTDISYSSIIYDLDNRPLYYLVEFVSGGYAIILRTHNIPIEVSYTSKSSPYPQNDDSKKYYVGMLSYATESNGQIISLNNKPLSQEGISASKKSCATLLNNIDNEHKQRNRQVSNLRQSEIQALYMQGAIPISVQASSHAVEVPNASYFSNAPFGNNQVGDCGPTATAMLIRYYDDNISSEFIDLPKYHIDDIWRDGFTR